MADNAVDDTQDDVALEARDLILGDMADRILEDINGHLYPSIKGFVDIYYGSLLSKGSTRVLGTSALSWPNPSQTERLRKASLVAGLLEILNPSVGKLEEEKSSRWVGRDTLGPDNLEFQGKPDCILINGHPNKDKFWQNVVALGTVREITPSGYQQAFLQVSHQAQHVFLHQPTRLFLHAFLVYGFTLEFILFNRAGVLSSEPLDIRESGNLLICVMSGFRECDSELHGLNDLALSDGQSTIMRMPGLDSRGSGALELKEPPIATPIKRITDAGALCYKIETEEEQDIVLKLAWESKNQRREIDILKAANERGVWGLPRLVGHRDHFAVGTLHRDLDGRPLDLGEGRMFSVEVSQRPSLGEQMIADVDRDTLTKTEMLADPKDNGLWVHTTEVPPERTRLDTEELVFTAVATSPVGHRLSEFNSVQELTLAIRDAIKAHRSLYREGRILHQDISVNNIVIPERFPHPESPRGILIDFDEARDLTVKEEDNARRRSSTLSDAEHQAIEIRGTRAFLAIDLMMGRVHTARHDLESFLYVLLWLCISHHAPTPPMTSKLNAWQALDSFPELAKKKAATVLSEQGWTGLLEEFTPSCEPLKGLAGRLRELLFPGGKIGICASEEEEWALYDAMIGAFDEALGSLGAQ